MSSPINFVDNSSENTQLFLDYKPERKLPVRDIVVPEVICAPPLPSNSEVKVSDKETKTNLTEEEKELFPKIGIIYPHEIETFRKFSN